MGVGTGKGGQSRPCYNISQYGVCYKTDCPWGHPDGCWVPGGSAANYPAGMPSVSVGLMKGKNVELLHRIMSDILHSVGDADLNTVARVDTAQSGVTRRICNRAIFGLCHSVRNWAHCMRAACSAQID